MGNLLRYSEKEKRRCYFSSLVPFKHDQHAFIMKMHLFTYAHSPHGGSTALVKPTKCFQPYFSAHRGKTHLTQGLLIQTTLHFHP